MSISDSGYNVITTLNAFKSCVHSDGNTIDLLLFVEAYKELLKYLDHLGKIFNFVKADLVDKFQNLDKCMKRDSKHYTTIQSSIEYEKQDKKVYMQNPNATLSILRLIRGLDFIRKFLENLYKNKDTNKKTPELAIWAYEETLAFRHNWVVRKMVRTGLYLLPYKADLISNMSHGVQNDKETDLIFKDFLGTIDSIYSIIHKLYDENNFLELVIA